MRINKETVRFGKSLVYLLCFSYLVSPPEGYLALYDGIRQSLFADGLLRLLPVLLKAIFFAIVMQVDVRFRWTNIQFSRHAKPESNADLPPKS